MCGGGEGVGVRGHMRENEERMLNKDECRCGGVWGVHGHAAQDVVSNRGNSPTQDCLLQR